MCRFKGLDLVDRVFKEYGWRFITLYRMQSEEREMQEGRWLSEEALQIVEERIEVKTKR